jgi:hypothetical protein
MENDNDVGDLDGSATKKNDGQDINGVVASDDEQRLRERT